MNRPRALVTGASGRLGAAVCAELRAGGVEVRALRHDRVPPVADEVVRGDILDGPGLTRACRDVTLVVHLAATTHSRSAAHYRRTNETGTRMVLAAAKDAGVERFVHVSTRAISPRGGSYSVTKLAAERIVQAGPLPFVIVRLPEVIGGAGGEGVDRLVQKALNARVVAVVGGVAELAPIGMPDAAAAVAIAARAPWAIGRVLTLAGEVVSMEALARRTAALAGRHVRIVRIPAPLLAVSAACARVLPLPLAPDQLARLRSPKAEPTPGIWTELGLAPAALDDVLRSGYVVSRR